MTKINMAEELRKRGFKLTPLPPPTPEQMKQFQKRSKHIVNFLKKIEKAHKATAKSTLRFDTKISHHSGHRSLDNKNRQKTKE